MNTYKLIISTPDGSVFDDEAISLIVRGTEGELAIMAGHIPFITAVIKGTCPAITASSPSMPRTHSITASLSNGFPSGVDMISL